MLCYYFFIFPPYSLLCYIVFPYIHVVLENYGLHFVSNNVSNLYNVVVVVANFLS